MDPPLALNLSLPSWVSELVAGEARYPTDEDQMALVVRLAGENLEREGEGGGPFAAAVFRQDTGQPVSAGLNSVVRLRNSVLHAEIFALMLAEQALGTHALGAPGVPALSLVSSCEPCAMCLGAVGWSGVPRLVCGAAKADAEAIGFDEGPVDEASYRYLARRGVTVVRGVLREEARALLERYRALGLPLY